MILAKDDEKSICLVSECLGQGKVVIIPTDTVYGFSGVVDLKNSPSCKKNFSTDSVIRKIKGREEAKPLIELIARPEDIFLYTDDRIPESLLEKWPGALTIIVNVKKDSPLLTECKTVAFRCPGDWWLREIISSLNCPVYSTSVNRSGSPVLAAENDIVKEFSNEVPLIVLDGDKKNALPSTLVRIDQNGNPVVLRQGAVVI